MTQNHWVGPSKQISLMLGGSLIALSLALGPVQAMGEADTIIIQPTHNKEESKANENNFRPHQSVFAPGSWQAQYSLAVQMIEVNQYDDAFIILSSLDQPDNADVLNYMGFTSRKLGRMEDARHYYEAALAIDPKHVGVLEYYGEWHVQMGNFDTARLHLAKIASLCGVNCKEYRALANEIAVPGSSASQEW